MGTVALFKNSEETPNAVTIPTPVVQNVDKMLPSTLVTKQLRLIDADSGN